MCYEYSDWAWKARAAELAKKERKPAEPSKEREQAEPQPATQAPAKDRETVPA